jgi:tetratricopeptide (TPR) repeat protein
MRVHTHTHVERNVAMIRRMGLCLALVSGAATASAQEPACPLYRVNASLLPISTDAGGPANKGGLFDGDIACVPRLQTVTGRQWGFVSYTLDPTKARTPVGGWSSLEFLQALSSAEAEPLGGVAPTPPAPVVSAPPPAAVVPGATVSAPAQPQTSEAERAWVLVKDTTDIRVLESYRQQYGAANPLLGRLAESRIEELKKRQAAVAPPTPTRPAIVSQPGTAARGWLGIRTQNIDADAASRLGLSEPKGALIVEVTTPGPGAAAGLKNGDAVLAINGNEVVDGADFTQQIEGYSPKARVDVLIRRGQQEQTITAHVGVLQSAEAKSCAEENGDVAIKICSELIRHNPGDEVAYINRGRAYGIKGELDRAIADFSKAIEINPKRAISYNNRGIAYQTKRDVDRAIADYGKAIEIDPKFANVYYNRGAAYQMKGNRDRAISDYRKALEVEPGHAPAAANLKSMGARP